MRTYDAKKSWQDQLHPLEREVQAVRSASGKIFKQTIYICDLKRKKKKIQLRQTRITILFRLHSISSIAQKKMSS